MCTSYSTSKKHASTKSLTVLKIHGKSVIIFILILNMIQQGIGMN